MAELQGARWNIDAKREDKNTDLSLGGLWWPLGLILRPRLAWLRRKEERF